MTNPPTAPGGGMPKWLIVLLVVFLVISLGCCGGFAMCHWMCSRVATSIGQASADLARELEKEAAARRAAAGSTPTGALEVNGSPTGVPKNFPADIVVPKGFAAEGPALESGIPDTGTATVKGNAKFDDVKNFYRTGMKDKGWTAAGEVSPDNTMTMLKFEKGARGAAVNITTQDTPDVITVNIIYGSK